MGGGHVGGQLALFFGLCQPKSGLTLSPAAPRAVSLQPSGRPARPALLVAKAMATPSNAPAERAHCVLQGQACCTKTSICTGFGGAGQDPSLPTPAMLGDIGTGASLEPASLPCHSTVGPEETATNPWRAGFLLAFIFTDA